jgi:gamma-glutamylputrescine oxidase
VDFLTANDRDGEYPQSYYAASAPILAPFPPLEGECAADVCIVGAGYTGLSAALHCAARGMRVVLLDAQRVGWGASGRNGGQAGADQREDQQTLEKMLGDEHARRLFELGLESITAVKELISRYAIDCHLKPGILLVDHKRSYTEYSRATVDHLNSKYDYAGMQFVDRDGVSERIGSDVYHSGILDTAAAHLHPLRYALGLAKAAVAGGVTIHERSRVTNITHGAKVRIETEQGSVTADHVLLACNGYVGDLDKNVAAHVMPINNFIIATEPLSDELARSLIRDDVAVADSKFVVNYWRLSQDNRLLFGGRESYGYRFAEDIKRYVRKPMLKVYPQLKDVRIDYGWGGTLAITRSRLPHFARVAPNVLSASGYSGHGVSMATLAGKLAAEAIAGQAERFDTMASIPNAPFPGGALLRWPALVLGMVWYGLRDKL